MGNDAPSASPSAGGSPATAFVACHAVALAGLAMAVAPFVFEGIEKAIGDGAFALVIVGGFIAITAFLSSFVFLGRLRIHRELLREDRLLAHWRYGEDEWRAFAQAEHATDRGGKLMLVAVVAGFVVTTFGAAIVLAPKAAGALVAVGFAVMVLFAGAAWLSAWRARRRNRTPTGEARIGRRGLWLNGALHTWSGGGTSLRDCRLDETADPACLVFAYSTPSATASRYTRRACRCRWGASTKRNE